MEWRPRVPAGGGLIRRLGTQSDNLVGGLALALVATVCGLAASPFPLRSALKNALFFTTPEEISLVPRASSDFTCSSFGGLLGLELSR